MVLGTKQDSDVSTLGGSAVAGRGYIIGGRANITLPAPHGSKGFFHSISLGLDYKHFDEDITVGTDEISTPIDYYPISANYGATWLQKSGMTELNAGVNFHPRGLGADEFEFDAKRYKAAGSYIFFRGDVAHTQDLPGGLQAYVKAQGQMASQPLVNSEQFSGGGLGSVRGYLESEALGDNALFGTLELRSPSLLRQKKKAPPPADSANGTPPPPPPTRTRRSRPATNGGSTRSSTPASLPSMIRFLNRSTRSNSPASASAPASDSGTTSTARSMPGMP